ncbi:MAG TPA: hypothetical protein VGR35_00230 [Tepidisphaeraceae bacterium]|nr:hypothetical protein [Tepidisphaeraceae bacterium]
MDRYALDSLPNGMIGGACAAPDVDRVVLEQPRSVVKIHHGTFDALKWPAPFSRHLFIDVELAPGDGGDGASWAIVIRGEDKRIIGRTNKPWLAELVFNDTDGSYRRFVLATASEPQPLRDLAEGLIHFYTSPAPLGERMAAATGNPALPVVLARFGALDYVEGNPSQRRCGPFTTLGPVRLRKTETAPAETAAA